MNQAPPQTALTVRNPKDLLNYLTKSRSAIEMALPKHLNPDRMMRLAMTCFSTSQALRNCTPQSILASIVVASQLGLEPGVAGQGYLIPYKGTCTFVPGWQGLVSLLNNTGRATAWTGSVFEGDQWVFELGSNPKCQHIPGENYGDPDKLIWVYACGRVNGSEQSVVEAWPMSRVWKHRDRYNKVGPKHYSYENPEMYARKVVLLQVLKYMPRSIELNNAITASEAAEIGHATAMDSGVIIEIDPENPPSGPGEKPNVAAKRIDATSTPSPGESPKKEQKTEPAGKPSTTEPEPPENNDGDTGPATPVVSPDRIVFSEALLDKLDEIKVSEAACKAWIIERSAPNYYDPATPYMAFVSDSAAASAALLANNRLLQKLQLTKENT